MATSVSLTAIHACRFANPPNCGVGNYFDTLYCRCAACSERSCDSGFVVEPTRCDCVCPIVTATCISGYTFDADACCSCVSS